MVQTPRTEFAQALKALSTERGLDAEVIIDTIKKAIVAAYRRDARDRGEDAEELDIKVEIDPVTGEAKVFAPNQDDPKKKEDITPPGFGRIAAQTAKQVIHQKIREAEKDVVMQEFSGRIGTLISGTILRFEGPDVRVDIGRTEGIMPASERIPNERLSASQRLSFLLKEISEGIKGKTIILSRADPDFVKKLFTREVPEMSSGSVEAKAISREAGVRTKISVSSSQTGVDPVGSCVGQKGVRVQAVTNELGGERVDIVPWSENTEEFIKAALAPAEGASVTLDEKEKVAIVTVPEDQLSLAIGKDGQNVRLAAKLTDWKIEIEGAEAKPEVAGDDKKTKAKKSTRVSKKKKKVKEVDEDKEPKSGRVEEKIEKKPVRNASSIAGAGGEATAEDSSASSSKAQDDTNDTKPKETKVSKKKSEAGKKDKKESVEK